MLWSSKGHSQSPGAFLSDPYPPHHLLPTLPPKYPRFPISYRPNLTPLPLYQQEHYLSTHIFYDRHNYSLLHTPFQSNTEPSHPSIHPSFHPSIPGAQAKPHMNSQIPRIRIFFYPALTRGAATTRHHPPPSLLSLPETYSAKQHTLTMNEKGLVSA